MTEVINTRDAMAAQRRAWRAGSPPPTVAVVMTMGALHAGHVELIRRARAQAAIVVVTEFLNPLQFAPGEDLAKYPRRFTADRALCESEGVDVMFAPTVDEIYPRGEPLVRISAGPVGDVLEGRSRPGHFDGVLTVVAKLLHITAPDIAFFGRKDAQQLWLIQRMVADLNFDVDVVSVPTVRDPDGLALSSRNSYLTPRDRSAALVLSRALRAAEDVSPTATRTQVLKTVHAELASESSVVPDYVELVDPQTFDPVADDHRGEAWLVVAAEVGSTRLIDNTPLHLQGGP